MEKMNKKEIPLTLFTFLNCQKFLVKDSFSVNAVFLV